MKYRKNSNAYYSLSSCFLLIQCEKQFAHCMNNCLNCFVSKGIRDVSKWSAKMRAPMENLYGVEYFPQLWSEWIDGMKQLCERNNGDICKSELGDIQAKTLIVHGAKDPMILAEHIPFLRKSIKTTE